ncbi:MAG TPA: pilus assembly protein TadG-related protein [Bryobacteraceae bacterium]|nr:pilus assembly protein TadG-related protein [Bryobacteraceae bacterium]
MKELCKETHRAPVRKQGRKQGGYVLFLFAAILVLSIAVIGIVFDMGRLFVAKAELQAYADAAAMFAASKLDGTRDGIVRAQAAALSGPLGATAPNKVNLAGEVISSVQVAYATSPAGTWDTYATATGPASNTYRFVRLTPSASTSLHFLPIINLVEHASGTVGESKTLRAVAVGGQRAISSFTSGGLVPFAPAAHNTADTHHFGLTPGLKYTLKWGNGNSTNCAGDAGFNPNNLPSEHGFVDLGQGNGNSSLRDVIEYSTYPNANSNPSSVSDGTRLKVVPGNRGRSIFTSLSNRSSQDPDQQSTTWAAYSTAGIGNWRRVVTAPIIDPASSQGNGQNQTMEVVGFGNFLLDVANTISGSSGPICATYIGPASTSGASSGGSDGRVVYDVQLYR